MTSVFDDNQARFDQVDSAVGTATFPQYLTRMASHLADVKRELHDLLGARPGDRVLDVGCGTGADVRALAERVGTRGASIGVDNSELLVNEAKAQSKGYRWPVGYRVADAHELPFPDATLDAVRSERVLMHLADPQRALRELTRVARPGGRVLVADPDHGMWALDVPDRPVVRTILAWWFDFITNPWIARQAPALCRGVGLLDVRTSVIPLLLTDLESADAMTGITRAAGAAAGHGIITEQQARDFDRALTTSQDDGTFFMCGAMIATVGDVPPRG